MHNNIIDYLNWDGREYSMRFQKTCLMNLDFDLIESTVRKDCLDLYSRPLSHFIGNVKGQSKESLLTISKVVLEAYEYGVGKGFLKHNEALYELLLKLACVIL